MTRFRYLSLASLIVGAAALTPAVASAQDGYMTCQATESVRQLVFASPTEFRADSADADKAFDYFTKAYQAGKAPLLQADLSHYQGICHWEAKKGVAIGMSTNYMIHFLKLGYAVFTEVVMPDPFSSK